MQLLASETPQPLPPGGPGRGAGPDSCKFAHIREDYKSGYVIEQEYEAEKRRKEARLRGLLPPEEDGKGDSDDDGLGQGWSAHGMPLTGESGFVVFDKVWCHGLRGGFSTPENTFSLHFATTSQTSASNPHGLPDLGLFGSKIPFPFTCPLHNLDWKMVCRWRRQGVPGFDKGTWLARGRCPPL